MRSRNSRQARLTLPSLSASVEGVLADPIENGSQEKRTLYAALLLALLCSLLIGGAQMALKWGTNRLRGSGEGEGAFNPGQLWGTVISHLNVEGLLTLNGLTVILIAHVLLAAAMFFYLLALRKAELTTIYPVLAARYVWVVALTPLFFPADSISTLKIAGAALAALGVTVVVRGGIRKRGIR